MKDSRVSILELRSVRGTGGGPEKTILLGTELADRGRFDVTVCYVRDLRDEIFGIDEWAGGLSIDYVEARERHSFDPRIWRTLTALVNSRRIDIVHAHDYKTIALAMLMAQQMRVIPLATAHGWTRQSLRERYVYYPLAKRLLARFPRVIAVSTEIKDDLERHGASPDRIVVLLNAISGSAFKRDGEGCQMARRALGYTGNEFVIGSVGRLEQQKRFDLLLEAFAPLARLRPELRLAIVGDGSLRADLTAQAARLNLNSRCAFLGHRSDIVGLHHAFDLFVQSSEYEGTPNAVLEAMAMETPLVATDAGGTREIAWPDVHALIVPTRDVDALRGAIDGVLADPSGARDRATAARRRIEADLSFEARTRRLETVYEDLIRERRAPAHVNEVPRHA